MSYWSEPMDFGAWGDYDVLIDDPADIPAPAEMPDLSAEMAKRKAQLAPKQREEAPPPVAAAVEAEPAAESDLVAELAKRKARFDRREFTAPTAFDAAASKAERSVMQVADHGSTVVQEFVAAASGRYWK